MVEEYIFGTQKDNTPEKSVDTAQAITSIHELGNIPDGGQAMFSIHSPLAQQIFSRGVFGGIYVTDENRKTQGIEFPLGKNSSTRISPKGITVDNGLGQKISVDFAQINAQKLKDEITRAIAPKEKNKSFISEVVANNVINPKSPQKVHSYQRNINYPILEEEIPNYRKIRQRKDQSQPKLVKKQ